MSETIHFPGCGDVPSDIQVTPVGDLREHELSVRCWCRPQRELEEPSVVVHNALDQRERYETGEMKPQ